MAEPWTLVVAASSEVVAEVVWREMKMLRATMNDTGSSLNLKASGPGAGVMVPSDQPLVPRLRMATGKKLRMAVSSHGRVMATRAISNDMVVVAPEAEVDSRVLELEVERSPEAEKRPALPEASIEALSCELNFLSLLLVVADEALTLTKAVSAL